MIIVIADVAGSIFYSSYSKYLYIVLQFTLLAGISLWERHVKMKAGLGTLNKSHTESDAAKYIRLLKPNLSQTRFASAVLPHLILFNSLRQ